MSDETPDELKTLVKNSPISILSENALTILYSEFSEIYCASYLVYNDHYLERFIRWVISGNDDDAVGRITTPIYRKG
jgi:hypothetical protein